MVARIEKVGLHVSGLLFVDVAYWPGGETHGEPLLRNDFLIEAPATAQEIVTDGTGCYVTVSGMKVLPFVEVNGDWQARPEDPADPWLRQTVTVDQAAILVAEILAYWNRQPAPGDHRGVPAAEVTAIGLPPDVAGLQGQVFSAG